MKPIEYKRTIQGMSCIFLNLKYGSSQILKKNVKVQGILDYFVS